LANFGNLHFDDDIEEMESDIDCKCGSDGTKGFDLVREMLQGTEELSKFRIFGISLRQISGSLVLTEPSEECGR
jgi:hypothetical protein